ncbi:penicillin-binding protein [Mesobacillus zeae]|uniref:serine-type D-Ala-D-Ala carboxypeptidase n=1 Tax=Mesobacillus zeae TaxID=1917180 RepID=A0A398BE38_9BACI|nr:penicillin-binding protein [Mesobacillus zeae]RID87904.1 penicillin-binding protein [Mesobacillus zeae]
MQKKQPNMNAGAAILFVIFSLLFFILIFRFVSLQVTGETHGQSLVAKAKQKYAKENVIEASRGSIFDRNGEVVAEDTTAYTLVAILDKSVTENPKKPKHVIDPEKTARELAKHIDMEESEIYKRLSKKGSFQVEFGKAGRDISHQTKREIDELHLPGITFQREKKRFYPNGVFSSHLIGYVENEKGKDGKIKSSGKLGIEASLNEKLNGQDGSVKFDTDLFGYLLPNAKKEIKPAKDGDNVYLTIDKKIQTFLEDAMKKVDKEYSPKKIIAVVADPKTGDILAMSQRPTFHPKTREGLEKSWHNEITETSIEPGSTMKIFTLAAAVEEKKFNPNELYQSGSYKVTPKSQAIRDHNYTGWGTISYLEGIQRSSNVAVAKLVSEKIGFDKYREYLDRFGFDKKTGIDLPNETKGKILYQWPVEKITTSYGQGTTVTPIQLVQAATAVANDGKMMKPRVIDKITESNTDKVVGGTDPKVAGNPISAETAKEVRDILETVVTAEKGTGRIYNIEGYNVAGKTGTSQIPGPDGRYMTGRENYIFSFLGMAPKDDPKLVMYVAVQQPELDEMTNGAVPVSEIFNTVMKSSLQYLNIKPATSEKATSDKIPAFEGESADSAAKALKAQGLIPVILGEGKNVTGQMPEPGSVLLEGEKVLIKTDGKMTVPDMTGWSLRDAMKFSQISGMNLNKSGTGYVSKQSIQPGAPVKKGNFIIVDLNTPEEQYEEAKKKESKEAEGANQSPGGEVREEDVSD